MKMLQVSATGVLQKLARILLPLQVGDELQKKKTEHSFRNVKFGIL